MNNGLRLNKKNLLSASFALAAPFLSFSYAHAQTSGSNSANDSNSWADSYLHTPLVLKSTFPLHDDHTHMLPTLGDDGGIDVDFLPDSYEGISSHNHILPKGKIGTAGHFTYDKYGNLEGLNLDFETYRGRFSAFYDAKTGRPVVFTPLDPAARSVKGQDLAIRTHELISEAAGVINACELATHEGGWNLAYDLPLGSTYVIDSNSAAKPSARASDQVLPEKQALWASNQWQVMHDDGIVQASLVRGHAHNAHFNNISIDAKGTVTAEVVRRLNGTLITANVSIRNGDIASAHFTDFSVKGRHSNALFAAWWNNEGKQELGCYLNKVSPDQYPSPGETMMASAKTPAAHHSPALVAAVRQVLAAPGNALKSIAAATHAQPKPDKTVDAGVQVAQTLPVKKTQAVASVPTGAGGQEVVTISGNGSQPKPSTSAHRSFNMFAGLEHFFQPHHEPHIQTFDLASQPQDSGTSGNVAASQPRTDWVAAAAEICTNFHHSQKHPAAEIKIKRDGVDALHVAQGGMKLFLLDHQQQGDPMAHNLEAVEVALKNSVYDKQLNGNILVSASPQQLDFMMKVAHDLQATGLLPDSFTINGVMIGANDLHRNNTVSSGKPAAHRFG